MAVQGFVVRASHGNQPYIARYADGTLAEGLNGGGFPSVREAQIKIEQKAGGRLLNWVREDRGEGVAIEAYVGSDP